eukprot:459185-Amphidinium_carterae.1
MHLRPIWNFVHVQFPKDIHYLGEDKRLGNTALSYVLGNAAKQATSTCHYKTHTSKRSYGGCFCLCETFQCEMGCVCKCFVQWCERQKPNAQSLLLARSSARILEKCTGNKNHTVRAEMIT